MLTPEVAQLRVGAWVVFAAGLSLAVGQSVALFAVRVSPRRFLASLVVQAVLFAAGFFFWALSVWWVARFGFDAVRPLRDVVAVIGLAYAPQLFGALILAPYLGVPLQTLLSAWTLLGTVVATSVVFGLGLQDAVLAAGAGWLVTQIGQRTIGRPLVRWGRRVRNWVVGADLNAPRRAVR
jgi:hypothetical protein